MKNVMIFQDWIQAQSYGHEWKQDELFRYFRAQVDNSIRLGWNAEDIVICTNLDFEYRGVTVVKLEDLCQFNKYLNKHYGIAELLRKGIITECFWFHDFDDWQLEPFEFPQFDGHIGMCKYIDFSQWNTGSIFIKPQSYFIWQFIVDIAKDRQELIAAHQIGDEEVLNSVYQTYPEFKPYFSLLNPRYNVGYTQIAERIAQAQLPVVVAGFKPGTPSYEEFDRRGLIDDDLKQIFVNHGLV